MVLFIFTLTSVVAAHHMAYEAANILHRDISSGNIMIGDTGEGYLIDWELSLNTTRGASFDRIVRFLVPAHMFLTAEAFLLGYLAIHVRRLTSEALRDTAYVCG